MKITHYSALCAVLVVLFSMVEVRPAERALMNNETKSGPITLRGRVTDVALASESPHSIVFDVNLHLDFVNTSAKPAILLQGEFWLGAKTLSSTSEATTSSRYLYLSSSWPSVSRAPKWDQLRQQLDQPSPPPELTRTLAPNESLAYDTRVTLNIEKRGSFDQTSASWETIRQSSPVTLQVTFETWSVNIEPRVDPDHLEFGQELQKRWEPYGDLQIERITSEPMPLDINNAVSNDRVGKLRP